MHADYTGLWNVVSCKKEYILVSHEFFEPSDPLSVCNFFGFLSRKMVAIASITDFAVLFFNGFSQRYLEKTSMTKSK